MSAQAPDRAAGAVGAGPAAHRIYVTDCEGPLTRNDNAQEIAERFIPDGAELFARLSKYDDFLADVVCKPGYNAGDTLRLLPPFLKAFAVTDEDVEAFSASPASPSSCRPSSSRPPTRRTSRPSAPCRDSP
jgi:hypothetical protein